MKDLRTVPHPAYVSALRELQYTLDSVKPGAIVWVVGPSGAGKSHLRSEIARILAGDPEQWGSGCIPLVSVRGIGTDRSKFNPKDFAMRLAGSMREPNLDFLRKNASEDDLAKIEPYLRDVAQSYSFRGRKDSSEHALRYEFERSARARKLKWLFIEEIASFANVHKSHRIEDYMLGLMQLAEETDIVLVLWGTHRSAALWENNEEVKNRSRWVWLRRYRAHVAGDLQPFASMLKYLGEGYKLLKRELLTSNLELVLANSAGIIGTLINWLDRADAARHRAGREWIDLSDLRAETQDLKSHLLLWENALEFDRIADAKSNLDLYSIIKKTQWAGGGND